MDLQVIADLSAAVAVLAIGALVLHGLVVPVIRGVIGV